MPRFLTVEEAADLLRLKPSSLRPYIRDGRLPAKRLVGGKTLLIEEADLLALLEPAKLEEASGPANAAEEEKDE